MRSIGLPLVALLASLATISSVFAGADACRVGDGLQYKYKSFMGACVSKCHLPDPLVTCPDPSRDLEGMKACIKENESTFFACLSNCDNRAYVLIGCRVDPKLLAR
jgi:hypothetical protein